MTTCRQQSRLSAAKNTFRGIAKAALAFHGAWLLRRIAPMVSRDFQAQLQGYGLTTAEIHYHMPDHPALLQLFIWQEYDLAPLFPGLRAFLDFWQRELDGALHSVRIAHNHLIRPSEWKALNGVFQLN
jgi:uncharacterized protein Usg